MSYFLLRLYLVLLARLAVDYYRPNDTCSALSNKWRHVAENLDPRKMFPGQGTFHMLYVSENVYGYLTVERVERCAIFQYGEKEEKKLN